MNIIRKSITKDGTTQCSPTRNRIQHKFMASQAANSTLLLYKQGNFPKQAFDAMLQYIPWRRFFYQWTLPNSVQNFLSSDAQFQIFLSKSCKHIIKSFLNMLFLTTCVCLCPLLRACANVNVKRTAIHVTKSLSLENKSLRHHITVLPT